MKLPFDVQVAEKFLDVLYVTNIYLYQNEISDAFHSIYYDSISVDEYLKMLIKDKAILVILFMNRIGKDFRIY